MFNFLKKNYEEISSKEVYNLISDKNYQIVDVRSNMEYRTGHIKNSKLIPLPELSKRINELDKEKTIIAVCASGARSGSASSFLSDQGFKVLNMSGGMSRWTFPTK